MTLMTAENFKGPVCYNWDIFIFVLSLVNNNLKLKNHCVFSLA